MMTTTAKRVTLYVAAALLLLLVLRALVVVIRGEPWTWPFDFNPDVGCRDIGYSCGVTNGILTTLLTLAFAGALFLAFRLRRIRTPYVQRACHETRDLVQTAGTLLGDVVGRDELCNVIVDDLRHRNGRRPHVVLGGVGVGKTAVLYQLTRVLAENGAVPVPIRLRDDQQGLDFSASAKRRFVEEVSGTSLSDAEAERAWRRLCRDDQVVVLADGLEEALSQNGRGDGAGDDGGTERDNRIRLALRAAYRERLPLVVASRPHDALVGLDAAIIELEPLSEEAALEYIETDASTYDEHRLDWVIETADVPETPIYLQLARELHAKGLLERAAPGEDAEHFDARSFDRVELRVRLLRTWVGGLVSGRFEPQLPMSPEAREATVAELAALACMGLKSDTLEVRFADLFERKKEGESRPYRYGDLINYLHFKHRAAQQRGESAAPITRIDIEREIRLAATRGVQLRLVEPRYEGVRFPHSIMQAYLASTVIDRAIADDAGYLDTALKDPARELLTALVMYSRRHPKDIPDSCSLDRIRRALVARSRHLDFSKRLDVVVAALEIDCFDRHPKHEALAEELASVWPPHRGDGTIEEAKLNAIARFGQVARTIARRSATERDFAALPAYRALYDIARKDRTYRVRLAAAQELGVGGDLAFRALAGRDRQPDAVVTRLGPALQGMPDNGWKDDTGHRELVLRAWLAPLLFGSVDEETTAARASLDTWLECLDPESPAPRLPLSGEIALAQGMKRTANRRLRHPHSPRPAARDELADRAAAMLRNSRFWYSRLTLVHALCLWALREPSDASRHRAPARRRLAWLRGFRPPKPVREQRLRTPRSRGSDAQALIGHWLSSEGRVREHPFVAEARDLAILALEKGEPERYLWIDESAAVTKIGSRPPRADAFRKHRLWIPPSTGWSALHPRAQRLVADVLLMLNLTERGTTPGDREKRLKQALREDLPPCLTGEREYLDPGRTVGGGPEPPPGASCKDGCAFDLCPYPPKGSETYRVELSEAFCRRQQVLLGNWWRPIPRRTARWQGATPGHLKRFWTAMEERARR